MSQFVSPGVYVIERDFSDYVASLQATSVGMIGTARKGPLNVPTLCTTPEQFLQAFGEPTANMYGPLAALNYLRRGSQLWYNRVAKEFVATDVELTAGIALGATTIAVSNAESIAAGYTIRIREAGLPTSIVKVASKSGDTLTTSATIAAYTVAATIDLDASTTTGLTSISTAANEAEVFGYTRISSVPVPTVKFTAVNPGKWANYGTKQGIEIVIEDSGQFANIDANGVVLTSGGVDLQGVVTTAPSVDNKTELLALVTDPVGTLRGVNYDSVIRKVTGFSRNTGATGTITLNTSSGLVANDTITVAGLGATGVNGTQTVLAVTSATTITFVGSGTGSTAYVASTGDVGTVEKTNGDHFGVVYRRTNDTALAVTNIALTSGVATLTMSPTGPTGMFVGASIVVAGLTGVGVPLNGTHVLTGRGDSAVTFAATGYTNIASTVIPALTGTAALKTWTAVGLLTKRVKVFYQGRQVEVFDNLVGHDSDSVNYWDSVIGSPGAAVSKYVYAEYVGSNGEQPAATYNKVKHPLNPRLLMGVSTSVQPNGLTTGAADTFSNATGRDGENPDAAAYIGTISEAGVHTGLKVFLKSAEFDINMLCVPAVTLADVVTEIISVCETRHDCLGIIDTPFGLTVSEAVDWHNGTGPYTGLHSAFVSNMSAMYYPWVQVFDPYTQREMWLPPSAVIPGVIAYNDAVGEIWYAPAGVTRGHVWDALKVEHNVTQGEMDYMYGPGNGNALNPIVSFSRDGITVYGQRTLQRVPTALDRVNVRRMLFYVEKAIATSVRKLVFEQDDPILWRRFVGLVTPFLQSMVGRRAIEDFKVVCDASTNPAERRNNNEMGAKLLIIPTKSAEKIVLDFTLMASGMSFDELIEQA